MLSWGMFLMVEPGTLNLNKLKTHEAFRVEKIEENKIARNESNPLKG